MGQFIRMPWRVYAADDCWVPPLMLERRVQFSAKNPFFKHADWRAWLVYRGDQAVGRISAQIDHLHLERHNDATGFFGLIEADDDPALFSLLLSTAEQWLLAQGMRRVRGPFNLSINEECGLLVDGFDRPPSVMMGHARPYYRKRIEEQGYTGVKDLLAYVMAPNYTLSKTMQRIVTKANGVGAGRLRMRPLRSKHLQEELAILHDIFNDAWVDNWGFVPFTKEEFTALGATLKVMVDDDFVQIAEVDGEPAAFIVALPNLNEAIHDLDGRLFPFGWLKLLWRLKRSYPKSARVALMGVRKRHQQSLLGTALSLAVINAVKEPVVKRGMTEVEMSWILEENRSMCNIIEALGGLAYKRYRIFEKGLA